MNKGLNKVMIIVGLTARQKFGIHQTAVLLPHLAWVPPDLGFPLKGQSMKKLNGLMLWLGEI